MQLEKKLGFFRFSGAFAAHVRFLEGEHIADGLLSQAAQPAAQDLLFRRQLGHVLFDEEYSLLPQCGGGFQPMQHGVCHVCAHPGMTLEMPTAGLVPGEAGGLANVMEQRRPAQGRGVKDQSNYQQLLEERKNYMKLYYYDTKRNQYLLHEYVRKSHIS